MLNVFQLFSKVSNLLRVIHWAVNGGFDDGSDGKVSACNVGDLGRKESDTTDGLHFHILSDNMNFECPTEIPVSEKLLLMIYLQPILFYILTQFWCGTILTNTEFSRNVCEYSKDRAFIGSCT